MAEQTRARWTNWAGNQSAAPLRIHKPRSEEEMVAVVRRAVARGERVKAVGSGHSFTSIALTDGHLLDLTEYNRIVESTTDHDPERHYVTVQSGIRLKELNPQLWDLGYSLTNLGDVAYQSISGAVSTATHGTGKDVGGLATQIQGLRVITGDGDIVDCSMDNERELFQAARVGVGAAGLISTVTLEVEPAFNLRAQEILMDAQVLFDKMDGFLADNEHFEFFWYPGSDNALTKRNNRTTAEAEPLPRWREFVNDEVVGHRYMAQATKLLRVPGVRMKLRSALEGARGEYVERSYKVFTSERKIRFYEMEYFIPSEHAREAFERVRNLIDRSGFGVVMPIEMRWVAPDDIPLSTAYGRPTTSIAVHMLKHQEFQPYFEAVETIMNDYEGRPHWGKLHFQTHRSLAPLYPEWDAYQRARKRLDPRGTFANEYTDRVLGPVR
ncbi:MAG: FAD-binding protein [Chloroflexi bacterium]|nr:FAD-binding protein [Chloroflexota bacterium]MDA1147172.1 FAD-binding protein [Chloroflexota bacterium]